ncbi:hypothetical protein PP939_gp172 [Rhizobium phage RL38J1]|uniref:Uncharacterized protein n=1 Tax=Rhizobium phage RL38J1 TaxID=2663232 RepID=A0A6B9JD13_9CAUD|nr:hypothetical protein PP939_gp172 [Rhizobium phage RL38J1]QGZ14066.1 hypothetical protein RL38J1_172 [Rhizobium phage RL38J1]
MKTFLKNRAEDAIELFFLMQVLLILSPLFFIEWVFSKIGDRAYLWFLENVSLRIEDSRYFQFIATHGWK